MDESVFEVIQILLMERGLSIDDARYEQGSFGSWLIYVGTSPRLGLVWDGRDGWLYVRREGDHQWEDLWIGRETQHTPDMAAQRLLEFAVKQGSLSG